MRHRYTRTAALLLAAALVLPGLGCGGSNAYSNSDTPVFFVVSIDREGDNETVGNPIIMVSNIDDLCTDITDMQIEVREVGGGADLVLSPFDTVAIDIVQVSFENLLDDGEDIPGVNVPVRHTYRPSALAEANGTLFIQNTPIVLASAKTTAPLDNSTGQGYPQRYLVHWVIQGHMLHNSSDRVQGETTFELIVDSFGPGASFPDLCQ